MAIGEWLMVLPAAALLAAAALRLLQPRDHEPARTLWQITEWLVAHLSRPAAAQPFLGLPGLVVLTGAATVVSVWREDPGLRRDATAGLQLIRRHANVLLVAAAVLLGSGIVLAVLAHIITD